MRRVSAIAVAGLAGWLCAGTAPAVPQPCEPPWPVGADLNGDWSLDAYDVLELVLRFGPCDEPCAGDLDGGGTIDLIDLVMLLAEIDAAPVLAQR
jgi:hypothetical protein